LRGHLKCKNQNNEDKGYLELTRDAKKEPFDKKTKKTLKSKTQAAPPPSPAPPKIGTKTFMSLQEFANDGRFSHGYRGQGALL
jgi:hypothetical protein